MQIYVGPTYNYRSYSFFNFSKIPLSSDIMYTYFGFCRPNINSHIEPINFKFIISRSRVDMTWTIKMDLIKNIEI